MRVLFLSPCGQLGGAERCLLDVMASLRRSEPAWQVYLIAGEDGPLLREAAHDGVAVSVVAFPASVARLGLFGGASPRDAVAALPAIWPYLKRLRCSIRAIEPDIVHTNGFKMHVLGALVSKKVPVIWHLHDYLGERSIRARALRLLCKRCNGAVAISKSVAADASRAFGLRVPVTTVQNAVDLHRFRPDGNQADLDALARACAAQPGILRIGLIATYARWKGHEVFLRALARPELKNVNWIAYIVGGPIYQTANSQHSESEMRSLAASLGIADRVRFTGFLEDSSEAMRALDIVIHASTNPEPFGLTIAEAMATGRAVIASESGGAAELFVNGQEAVGVAPGDERLLAIAIARLATDPIARDRLGRAARRAAEENFDSARLGPQLAELYRQTVKTCEHSTSTAEIFTAV